MHSLFSSVGAVSHASGALFFLILTTLLLTNWRGRLQGGLLVFASVISALWSMAMSLQAAYQPFPLAWIWTIEVIRNAVWFLFLFNLLRVSQGRRMPPAIRNLGIAAFAVCIALLLARTQAGPLLLDLLGDADYYGFMWLLHVVIAVIGLFLVEQLYRNTQAEQRWAIKFLCLGVGGMYAYDLYMYSDALMFQRIDIDVWQARGAVGALVVPMIGLSAARNPQWSVEVFVSRRIIMHTAALLGAGIYLLLMAVAGFYIRYYGGDWGGVLQLVFLFGSLVVLISLMFSGHLRARTKVFFSKHFFNYKYDYREEWLRLMRTLSFDDGQLSVYERSIRAIASIVDCKGGAVWTRSEHGSYAFRSSWGIADFDEHGIDGDHPMIRFLRERDWVVRLDEFDNEPELYEGMCIPDCLSSLQDAWLIVPLMHLDRLTGFVVLAGPQAPLSVNWEDIDLLKLAGRQAAAHLAQHEAAQALADARQFEAFNRVSAFVIHDLKNLIAQLSLVVSNAERHKHNPAFMDDAIDTISHAVERMNGTMKHLRSATNPLGAGESVDVALVLKAVVDMHSSRRPVPELAMQQGSFCVRAEKERFSSILGHLIQNAQDATAADGYVRVGLRSQDDYVVVEISDNGCGMDAAFVRERLFRPFDTTKGLTGMGIGAYESREFIRSLGGDIKVQSELGKGSSFQLRIPLARDAVLPDAASQSTQ